MGYGKRKKKKKRRERERKRIESSDKRAGQQQVDGIVK